MKSNKIFIGLLLVSSLIFVFYCFQYRPSKIRSDCSWVQKHIDPIPYRPEKTENQLLAEGVIEDCSTSKANTGGEIFNFSDFCENHNKSIIESNKEAQAQPARDWVEQATEEEYQFCIRSKGLRQ